MKTYNELKKSVQNLPVYDKGVSSVGRLIQGLDKIRLQLWALEEDPDHRAIILRVHRMLSPDVLKGLTCSKLISEQWTPGNLKEALEMRRAQHRDRRKSCQLRRLRE
uniref:Uncharacterized protein n=1 Tax=Parascaris univalens TaxID=6257 RepID=A0A915A8P2_PARUN